MGRSIKGTKYKLVQLTRGLVTAVSPEDYAEMSKHTWFPVIKDARVDGAATNTKRTRAYLSRLVAERVFGPIPEGMQVDHWNGYTLDNRRCNLRLCSPRDNTRNRPKATGTAEQYLGVQRRKGFTGERGGREFMARVAHEGKNKYLGVYATAEEAARARDDFCRAHFGAFFVPNFPLPYEMPPVAPKCIREQVPGAPQSRYSLRSSDNEYIGVSRRTRNSWRWTLEYRGKTVRRGRFRTAEEAAISRDAYIREHGLPHALAFPEQ